MKEHKEIVAVEQRIEKLREPRKPAKEEDTSVKYHKLVLNEKKDHVMPERISEEEFMEYFRKADYDSIETFKDKAKHQVDPVAPDKVTDIEECAVTKIDLRGDQ